MCLVVDRERAHLECLVGLELRFRVVGEGWVCPHGLSGADRWRYLLEEVLLSWGHGAKVCNLGVILCDYGIDSV